eukprot:905900-Pyramimonas_sp.AAC.1
MQPFLTREVTSPAIFYGGCMPVSVPMRPLGSDTGTSHGRNCTITVLCCLYCCNCNGTHAPPPARHRRRRAPLVAVTVR